MSEKFQNSLQPRPWDPPILYLPIKPMAKGEGSSSALKNTINLDLPHVSNIVYSRTNRVMFAI